MVNSVCLTRNTLLSFEKVSPAQENTFTISILTIYVSLLDSQSRGHHNKIPLSFQLELLITDLYRIDRGGSWDKIAASYNWRIMGTKLSFEQRQAGGQNCLSQTICDLCLGRLHTAYSPLLCHTQLYICYPSLQRAWTQCTFLFCPLHICYR